jgi:V/A-type H+-transporting ATPase subunit C
MATVHKHSIIYSLGRVKELEKGLLIETNLDRVLEADDPYAVLRSIGFFKAAEEYGENESLETIFLRERTHNRRLLHELLAESPLEDIFLLPYDIQNIKLLLKGKLASNSAVKDVTLEEGKFSKAELIKAIYDEAPTDIPAPIIDDLKWITAEFQDSQRFALVDYRLDRRLRLLQLDIARKAKNRFMVEYIQRLSDLQNVAGTFRRKFHLLESDSLSETLVDTGTLAPSFFERIYSTGWESIVNTFKPTEYGNAVTKALAQVEQPYFLALLDVYCASYLLEFLRKTKQISFGIEPLLAFYLARDHELKIVRTIWIGKQFEYTQDKLTIRMRELY